MTKGGSGTVIVPLADDDPLIAGADGEIGTADDPAVVPPPDQRFMVLTRATNQPGPDNTLGTGDDVHEHTNTTTPFVDQNQTYTSHPVAPGVPARVRAERRRQARRPPGA